MDANSMLIGGQWQSAIGTGKTEDVTSPYDGSVVGSVPVGSVRDVDAALTAAERQLLGLSEKDTFEKAVVEADKDAVKETGREGLAGPSEHGVIPTGEFLAIVPLGGGYYFCPPIPNQDLSQIGQQFFS